MDAAFVPGGPGREDSCGACRIEQRRSEVNQTAMPMIEKLSEQRTREAGVLSVNRAAERVNLPLAAHRISARVADRVAEVTVEQTFHNPFQECLEAVYIFP